MQHAAISRAEQDEWLAELMQTYGDDILRLCYVILQDRALAEDASQEVFLKAYKGVYDIVVAMYHDQGHIPMKMMAFDSGVNVTLGLPIIRTSVDHGTAFDIAGKGIANVESMLYAVDLGQRFASGRH